MAQNILTVPIDKFSQDILKISSKSLVNLIRGIYDTKWENGWKMGIEQIKDLERKQTKIEAELMRRKFLTKTDLNNYYMMLRSINFKKKVF